jgi:hypothetical protein
MAEVSDEMLVKLASGVEVTRSQVVEMSRRIALLEGDTRHLIRDIQPKVGEIEGRLDDLEFSPTWRGHALQAAVWVFVITMMSLLGDSIGVKFLW